MKTIRRARLLALASVAISVSGLICAHADTIYVALSGSGTIEQFQTNGDSTTFAVASLAFPEGVAFDAAGNMYVANNSGGGNGNGSIEKFTPAGAASTYAADPGDGSVLGGPEGLAFDSNGNLYVANDGGWIEEFAPDGTPSLFISDPGDGSVLNFPYGLAFDSSGNLYAANSFGGSNGFGSIEVFSPGAVPSLFISDPGDGSLLNGPEGIAFDSSGNLYVANSVGGANGFGTVEKVASNGSATVFASDPGTGAVLNGPFGLAFDKSGNLYVVNSTGGTGGAGSVEKFKSNGSHSVFVSDPGDGSILSSPFGLALDSSGNLFVANAGDSQNVQKFNSSALLTETIFNTLSNPAGMAFDGTGNLFVANTDTGAIQEFSTNAAATLFVTNDGAAGLTFDSAGNLYSGSDLDNTIWKFGTNGVGVVFASSGLANPQGIVFDNAGNLYAVNQDLNTIEKYDTNGNGTVFTTNSVPFGVALAFDTAGNLYAELANAIEKIAPNGTTSIFASDPGNGSVINSPQGMDFDSAGNLYVANFGNGTIEKFDNSGKASVFASNVEGPSALIIQRSAVVGTGPFAATNLNVMPRFHSAIITWTTTANAAAQVQYGTTPAYGAYSALNTTPTTNQAVLLTGLNSNTVYYFQTISTSGTNVAGQSGSFTTDVPPLVIQSLQAIYQGVWTLDSSAPDKFSDPYKYCATTIGAGSSAEAFFRPNIVTPGFYDVFVWYSEGPNRSTNVPVLVSCQGGEVFTNINQTIQGGSWQLVAARQFFAAGTNGFLRLANGTGESNKVVIADAAQWAYSSAQDNAVNGTIPAWWAGYYFGTNTVNGSTQSANGYSLLADYVIGLSPVDPAAIINLGVTRIAGGFQSTFSPWEGGRNYGLQSTTNLQHPVWLTVPNLIVSENTNGQGIVTCTNTTGSRRYFRLSVQLMP